MVGLCQRHKPQHPHHIKVSPWGPGLRETFIKRYIAEMTNKAEIRPEERSVRKRSVVGRIYGLKYSSKDEREEEGAEYCSWPTRNVACTKEG